jgi:hypothetical protein
MKRFFGGLLIAVGALIALLSGACSMFVLIVTIDRLLSGQGQIGPTVAALAISLIPMAIGVGLIWAGLRLSRDR